MQPWSATESSPTDLDTSAPGGWITTNGSNFITGNAVVSGLILEGGGDASATQAIANPAYVSWTGGSPVSSGTSNIVIGPNGVIDGDFDVRNNSGVPLTRNVTVYGAYQKIASSGGQVVFVPSVGDPDSTRYYINLDDYFSGTGTFSFVAVVSLTTIDTGSSVVGIAPNNGAGLVGLTAAGLYPAPPTLDSAFVQVAGSAITAIFNIASGQTPMLPSSGAAGYSVHVNGSPRTITGVTNGGGIGDNMIISVSPSIIYSDTVTLAYAPGNVTDSYPTALGAFSATAVTNDSNLGRAPTFSSGVVDSAGTQVTVNFTCYDPPMLPSSSATGFILTSGGVTQTITSTSVSGAAIVLNVAIPIGEGLAVTLQYAPGNVTDTYPASLAAFGPVAIANDSTHPVPPTFASGYINAAGTALVATFNISAGQTPMLPSSGMTGLTVKANGTTQTIASTSALSGDTVTINLSAPVPYTDTVTLAYTPGNITDSYPTDLAAFSATAITNNSNVGKPPTFASAATDTTGLIVTVNFICYDAPMLPSSGATGLEVLVNGSGVGISTTSASGSTQVLNLASAIHEYATVTILYDEGLPGNITDSYPAALSSFGSMPVTNNSTVPTPLAVVDSVYAEYLATPVHIAVVDQVFSEYLATLEHVAVVDSAYGEYLATPIIAAVVDSVYAEYLATPPTPMTVTIESPVNGDTVNGIVVIQGLVTGGFIDVASVSLYVNGSLVSTQMGIGDGYYALNWNSTATADGSYVLTLKGIDGAGNIVWSSPVTVTTDNGEGPATCYLYSDQETAAGNIALALLTCNLVPSPSYIDSYVITQGINIPGTSTNFDDGSWQKVNLNEQFIPTVQGDTFAYCFKLARTLELDAVNFTADIVSMIADPLTTPSAPGALILDSAGYIWTFDGADMPVLLLNVNTILLGGESITSFAALNEKVYVSLVSSTPTTRLYVYDRTVNDQSYAIIPFSDPIEALVTTTTLLYIGTHGGNVYSFDGLNLKKLSPTPLPHAVTGMNVANTSVSNTIPGVAVFLSDGSAWDINSSNATYGANQTFAPIGGVTALYSAINQIDSGQATDSRYISTGSAGNVYLALPGQPYMLDTTVGFAAYAMAPYASTEFLGGADGKLFAKNQNPPPDTLAWSAVSSQIGNLTSINSLLVLGSNLIIGGSAGSGDTLWIVTLASIASSPVTARYIRDVAMMITQFSS